LAYKRDSKWWPVTRCILQWCLDRSITKIVKWFGESWRAIHGLMFSGEYMTSQGDSYYLELLFECFDMWFRDYLAIHHPHLVAQFESDDMLFKDYGDDGVLSYSQEFVTIICQGTTSPVLLGQYLKDYFFMELKMSDTYVCYDDPDMLPEQDVGFITRLGPNIIDTRGVYRKYPCGLGGQEVDRKGVKFLKRYFIRGDNDEIVPWRPTEDYFLKSICVANSPQDIARHVIRLRALACDTYGTNQRAYDHLKRMDDYIVAHISNDLYNQIDEMLLDAHSSSVSSEGSDFGTLDNERIIHKIGGSDTILALRKSMPTISSIYDRTKRNDEILWRRQVYASSRLNRTAQELAQSDYIQ